MYTICFKQSIHSTGSSTSMPAATTPARPSPTIDPTGITRLEMAVDWPISFSLNQVLAMVLIELKHRVCVDRKMNVPSNISQISPSPAKDKALNQQPMICKAAQIYITYWILSSLKTVLAAKFNTGYMTVGISTNIVIGHCDVSP